MRVLALLLMAVSVASAQIERATLVGLVTDPSGGAVPNAAVSITNTATNGEAQVRTDDRGFYASAPLWPGTYRISIQAPGFKTWSREVRLDVNQRAQVDAALTVGEISDKVTVTGEAPLLETQTATLGNVRTEAAIRNLPLNGRNFIQLTWLAPGVQPGNTSNISNGARGNQSASVNGGRGSANSFLIDGIYDKENSVNGNIYLPSPDAIEEFKVQTSVADAQFGHAAGGVINVMIKSGTNDLHGSLFEFLRNSALDAKNVFDSPAKPIPPFRLNQFGGTLGGPVVIPGRYNGRNKTFFFVDYQGSRQRKSASNITTVPTEAMRAGDFSAISNTIFDPLSIHPDPADPTGKNLIRDAFPGNRIPQNRLNPVSTAAIALYPSPTLPGVVNNITTNPAVPFDVNQMDVRIDQRFGDGDSLFGRYSFQDDTRTTPGYFPPPAVGAGPGFPTSAGDRAQQVVIGWTHSFTATAINEARAGFTRLGQVSSPITQGTNLAAKLGIPGVDISPLFSAMTSIYISSYAGLGEGGSVPLVKINNNFQYSDTVMLTHGMHSFRFGGEVVRRQINTFDCPNPLGAFTFNGQFTNRGIGVSTAGTGNAMADFLLGAPASVTYTIMNGLTGDRRTELGVFIQDDIRLTSRLTLNLGLRYDLYTPNVEVADRMANFVPELGDIFPAKSPQVHGTRATVATDYNNFAPRVGFAFRVQPKTVIRSAYGIFYGSEDVGGDPRLAANPPFVGNPQFNADYANFAADRKISDGLPAERPTVVPSQGPGLHNPIRYRPFDSRTPYVQQWNFNVQRELPGNMLASAGYVGSKGTKLALLFDLNQAIPGPAQVDTRRPWPNFGGYGLDVGYWANSTYNSFQAALEKRFSAGLAFLLNYTWSHSLDNASQPTANGGAQNAHALALEHASSDFDMRHRFVASWSYELPIGRGKSILHSAGSVAQALAGGWQLNAIQYVDSGMPFTPVMAGNLNTLNGTGTQRPDRIGSGVLKSGRNPSHWFDQTAFKTPAPYTFGNSGRNILTGPRQANSDVSLFKNFTFGSEARRYLQFRTEVFNVFNTPQFNNPNASIGDPSVARITSAGATNTFVGANRQIQFSLKLYF
ncbi:MAG TPA: TonB-dependent receptor [Bryobacteraceae bacterium]|nr:TonB-dependent receptor [Bryobacteraceae bacterium]